MFAKHMKVQEQVQWLKAHVVRSIVGTPNRLLQLVERNALRLDSCRCLILDCWLNDKQQNLLGVKEVWQDTAKFIVDHCMTRITSGQMKLALF